MTWPAIWGLLCDIRLNYMLTWLEKSHRNVKYWNNKKVHGLEIIYHQFHVFVWHNLSHGSCYIQGWLFNRFRRKKHWSCGQSHKQVKGGSRTALSLSHYRWDAGGGRPRSLLQFSPLFLIWVWVQFPGLLERQGFVVLIWVWVPGSPVFIPFVFLLKA